MTRYLFISHGVTPVQYGL